MSYHPVFRGPLLKRAPALHDNYVFGSEERSLRCSSELRASHAQGVPAPSRSSCASVRRRSPAPTWCASCSRPPSVADGSLANLASELRSALNDPPGEARLPQDDPPLRLRVLQGPVKEEQAMSLCRLLGPDRD